MANPENIQPDARNMAMQELFRDGIDPDSEEGQEFLHRVNAFGIMGSQPPNKPKEPEIEVIIGC